MGLMYQGPTVFPEMRFCFQNPVIQKWRLYPLSWKIQPPLLHTPLSSPKTSLTGLQTPLAHWNGPQSPWVGPMTGFLIYQAPSWAGSQTSQAGLLNLQAGPLMEGWYEFLPIL